MKTLPLRCCLFFFLMTVVRPSGAHELRPAYLELRQTAPEKYEVLWKVPAKGEMRLGIYVNLPDSCLLGRKFTSSREDSWVERWTAECRGGLIGKEIHVAGLSVTLTDALVRLENQAGNIQVLRLTPAQPSFTVPGEPKLAALVKTYFLLGIEHILLGIDHLLFILALLLIVKGWRRMIGTVTAFTLAHSLTLAAATLGLVHVPQPPAEAVIALSIAFVAAEIVHGRQGRPRLTQRCPWVVAFLFGLLHGLGFAGALSEVGLPQGEIPLALLTFNLGVEAGQILFIAGILLLLGGLRRIRTPFLAWSESWVAYAIGGLAMFWVIQRMVAF